MTINTILVPFDGSQLSRGALPHAEALADATGATLLLLGAVEPAWEGWQHLDGRRFADDRQRELERFLDGIAAHERERGVAVHTLVVHGDPVAAINSVAKERADLIVMATRGRGGIQRGLLGSVADKVMRTGKAPTLLVQSAEAAARPEPARVQLRRLMVPLDGSPAAEAALGLAVPLARAAGAALTLVQVQQPLPLVTGYADPSYTDEIDNTLAAVAGEYLQRARKRLPADLSIDTAVLRGSPYRQIPGYARTHAVDLVVMSTHGRGGLRRMVLGSVADRMVRAGVPVLLIRSQLPAVSAENATVAAASPPPAPVR